MNLGDIARKRLQSTTLAAAIVSLLLAPAAALAQDAAPAVAVDEPAAEAVTTEGAADITDALVPEDAITDPAPAFDYYGPDMIKGEPTAGAFSFQDQYSPNGEYALWMHDAILMPLITIISLFVLLLLMWVIVRFRRARNPVASKTSHNTLIEVVWTILPIFILIAIAWPSMTLLANQYKSPPEDAITIKANGYQWYWGYEYVDNGGFEVISNMKDEADALAEGEPPQLAVDNRMVVPVGEPIRIQTFGKDVIHSFGIPSLWFKIDAVPGRINERMLTITEPGIYYGQCMELCGARHGYMPIAIEARPRAEFEAWVRAQGGTIGDEGEVEPDVSTQVPASALEDAPAAGEAPTEDTAPTQETVQTT